MCFLIHWNHILLQAGVVITVFVQYRRSPSPSLTGSWLNHPGVIEGFDCIASELISFSNSLVFFCRVLLEPSVGVPSSPLISLPALLHSCGERKPRQLLSAEKTRASRQQIPHCGPGWHHPTKATCFSRCLLCFFRGRGLRSVAAMDAYVQERQEKKLGSLFAHQVTANFFFKVVFKRGNFNLSIFNAFCWSGFEGDSAILCGEEHWCLWWSGVTVSFLSLWVTCCQERILQFGGYSSSPIQVMSIHSYVAAMPGAYQK